MSERSCRDCQYRPVCSTRRTCGDSAWCCSTYKKRIDRDALLALADEMDERSRWICIGDAVHAKTCAHRIREALGVGK